VNRLFPECWSLIDPCDASPSVSGRDHQFWRSWKTRIFYWIGAIFSRSSLFPDLGRSRPRQLGLNDLKVLTGQIPHLCITMGLLHEISQDIPRNHKNWFTFLHLERSPKISQYLLTSCKITNGLICRSNFRSWDLASCQLTFSEISDIKPSHNIPYWEAHTASSLEILQDLAPRFYHPNLGNWPELNFAQFPHGQKTPTASTWWVLADREPDHCNTITPYAHNAWPGYSLTGCRNVLRGKLGLGLVM
jgi:hypothetical protein